MATAPLTRRQDLLLHALACQVRVISHFQVIRWLAATGGEEKRVIAPLLRENLLEALRLHVRKIKPPSRPLAVWRPGEPCPDAGRISYLAKKRYRRAPVTAVTAYVPTARLLDLFGVPPRKPFRRGSADHDLGVTEMWLYAYKRWPKVTHRCWEGEDLYGTERLKYEKVEDARLVHPHSKEPWVVFEYAGAYRKDRVQAFHSDLEERGLPYWMF